MTIKGKLISCKREAKEFDKKRRTEEKLFITLAESDLSEDHLMELKEAFKDAGNKFTPDWIKDYKGYVNLSTKFDLPFRDIEGNEYASIEEEMKNNLKWMGADVRISIKLKDAAIYPSALIFDSEGKAVNAFAEFDE